MVFRRYLNALLHGTLLLLLLAGLFNLSVDPYGLFGWVKIEGFNTRKPEIIKHARMYKAHAVRRVQPDVVILGSSRADTGIDPYHLRRIDEHGRYYNLALHSANIEEVFRYLKHAHHVHPLKEAIIGLDFFMFNVNKEVEIDFDPNRLEPGSILSLGWVEDIFKALFTYDALKASWATLSRQDDPSVINYGEDGFRDDSMKWAAIAAKGGHRQAAINNERYALVARDGFPFFSIEDAMTGDRPTLETFRGIVRFGREEGIRLRLFLSPIHTRRLLLLEEIGLWEQFEEWKRGMVRILTEENAAEPLWDFTTPGTFTTEEFPPLGDTRTRMKWYWESSHYTKALGNLVVDRLLGVKDNSLPHGEPFGVALSQDNIEEELQLLHVRLQNYRKNHPENVREISGMIRRTRGKRELLFQMHPELWPKRKFGEAPAEVMEPR